MDFRDPPRRAPEASLLPMINVVFLLLIFFLISARMTPPAPFAVTPPDVVAAQEAQGLFTLYLDAEGRAGYRDASGEAALPALVAARDAHCAQADCALTPPRLALRADAASPAAVVAALVRRLGAQGFADLELVVLTQGGAP